jgi:predicted  nucleic acid-binding Zn-ribbon protein
VGVVKDAIDRLTRLQALDSQIRKFKSELEEKPRLMGAEKKQLDDARAALVEAEKKARDAQKAADRKELDVRTKEDAIKKLEGK